MQTQPNNPINGAAAGFMAAPQQPSDAAVLLARARNAAFAEAAQGRVGRGLNLLADALEVEPLSHDLMSDMAALLLAAGELEQAVSHGQRALEVEPNHGPSLYTLGFALAGLGKIERALNVLIRLNQGEPQASLQREAPELAPLAQAEMRRLMTLLALE